jgi:hypothetical protein
MGTSEVAVQSRGGYVDGVSQHHSSGDLQNGVHFFPSSRAVVSLTSSKRTFFCFSMG